MPGGPGANPLWSHETLSLPIGRKGREFRIGPLSLRLQWGRNEYVFRTFSLMDLWTIWPYLMPAHEAVLSGSQPVAYAECVLKVLEVIQPEFAAAYRRETATRAAFTGTIVTVLVEFYQRHDWQRIGRLMDASEARSSDESRDYPTRTAHQTFVLACAAAARACNMSVQEFVDQRIEFCADQFIALDHAAENVERQQSGERAESWRDAVYKLSAAFSIKPVALATDAQPEWMRHLNTYRVVN